ncbi:pentapeptide repeat-containing protein [Lacrimispora sp. JR3]|uniref:pentapeptide repeat-containing protein n=1 Tax=Lacrimispora sinapis TaxID=3111456 RepID=UPI003748B0A9
MENKAFQLFREKEMNPCLSEILQEAEVIFQSFKDDFRIQFIREFSLVCEKQKENIHKMTPGYIMCHLLRTDLIRGKYRCPLFLYDKNWYYHIGMKVGELQMGELFHLYGTLWDKLRQLSKRYVGHVTMPEVDEAMQDMVTPFYLYLKELVLYAVGEATDTDAYLSMEKEDNFQIRIGEYVEPGDLVYREQPKKDAEEIRRQLEEATEEAYLFEDFKGLDLSHLMLSGRDFRYSDFRKGRLEKSNFNLSLLIGSCFRNSNMAEATFVGSMFHNADFTNADLQHADFSCGVSYHGKSQADAWRTPGYTGASFRNSNLSGASFLGGVYMGSDFRGARLTGCNFTDAVLYESIFTEKQALEANLSSGQLEQIHLAV